MRFSNDSEKLVFAQIKKQLPDLVHDKCHGYDEFYGYKLVPGGNGCEYYQEKIADDLIFKLCQAYKFNEVEIIDRVVRVLNWRRDFNPLKAGFLEQHDSVFENIGYLTTDDKNDSNKQTITWNLYGQIKDRSKMFGTATSAEKFIRYRIGLMERGIRLLEFDDPDNCYMTQVHDYKGVSMFNMDSKMKACVKQIVGIFQDYYPETLYAKYFVNVPTLLAWIYDIIIKFVDRRTRDKFVVLGNGNKLGQYVKHCPKESYGGDNKLSLLEQHVDNIRPTEYGLFLLQQQSNEDVE